MESILKKQINLNQTSLDSYDISWDVDWTLGASMKATNVIYIRKLPRLTCGVYLLRLF